MDCWTRKRTLAALGAVTLLLGCSSEGPTRAEEEVVAPATCATRGEECFASQMICVASDDAERCEPCPEGQYAASADGCEPIPGTRIDHAFEPYTVAPGVELNDKCQSWTLNNETELWVHAVEMENDGAYHHSNWLFVPDDVFDGPDGIWNCRDREYNEVVAAAAGGVLFAQSTQAERQVQKMPEGVAVRLPPRARILGGTHIMNTSIEPVTTTLRMRLYAIAREEVTVPLTPLFLDYRNLTIQPSAVSKFTAECDLSADSSTPGDLNAELYYVMPHYHALGRGFDIEIYGGPRDGEVLYELGGYDAEAHAETFNPPVSMRGSKGFRFSCTYENPWPLEVGYGVGNVAVDPEAGEMCMMLGFMRSDFLMAGVAGGPNEVVSEAWGYHHTSPCTVLQVEFKDRQGGL
jgi:hypothetical protein